MRVLYIVTRYIAINIHDVLVTGQQQAGFEPGGRCPAGPREILHRLKAVKDDIFKE
jgi:hypothetical protein